MVDKSHHSVSSSPCYWYLTTRRPLPFVHWRLRLQLHIPLCHLVSLFLMIPPLHLGEPSNALCSWFFDLLISGDFSSLPLPPLSWCQPESCHQQKLLPLTFPSTILLLYHHLITFYAVSSLPQVPSLPQFCNLSQLLIRSSQPEKLEKYQCLGLFSRWLKSGKNSGGGPGHQWYYFLKAPQVIYTCRQGWEPLPNPCTLSAHCIFGVSLKSEIMNIKENWILTEI